MNKNYLLFGLVFLLLVSVGSIVAIDESVFAHYNLNEVSGNVLDDVGGYNLLVSSQSAPSQPGKYLTARGVFNNTAYFNTTTFKRLNYTDNFSISFWIYVISNCSDSQQSDIFDYGAQLNNFRITMICGTNNRISFYISKFNAIAYNKATSTPIPLNTWTNVVATYNGSGTIRKIYVRGVLDNTTSDAVSGTTTNNTLTFGRDFSGGNQNFSQGYIDEMVWFNKTLSASDVVIINNSVNGYPYDNTSFYFLARDSVFNTNILNFSIIVNGTLFYSNVSSGILTVNSSFSDGALIPINVSANNYVSNNTLFTIYHGTNNVGLYPLLDSSINISVVNISGVLINSFNVSIIDSYGVVSNYNTSSGYLNVFVNSGINYTLLFNNSNYSYSYVSIIPIVGNQSVSAVLYPRNALNITIRDEISNLVVFSNTVITFSAVNPSFNFPYTINGSGLISGLSANYYSLLLSNPSYSIKNYVVNVPDGSFQNLNLYLNNGTATLFNFKTSGGNVLSGVVFNVYSYVNNSLTLTESGVSDVTGKVQVSIRPNVFYSFSTFLSGYANYSFSLPQVLFNSYDVVLFPSSGVSVTPSATVTYSPNIFIMSLNNSFRINFYSLYGSFNSYYYNVSFFNGSISGFGNVSGGQILSNSFIIPKSPGDSVVTVFYNYSLSNGASSNFTYSYRVPVTYVNHTLVSFGHDDYGLLIGDKIWVMTLILLPIVALAFVFGGMVFGLFSLMVFIGIFGASGFIPGSVSLTIIILCLLYIFGRGNQ